MRILVILVMLALPILGCCLGYFLSYQPFFQEPELDGWISLGRPPKEVETLRAAEFYTVYIETVDGTLYSCYRASPYDRQCWIEVTQIPDLVEYPCVGLTGSFPLAPPSVQVIDRLQIDYCNSFAGQTDRSVFVYLLLANGEILQKGNDLFHLGPPSGLFYRMLQGAISGFLIGCFVDLILIYLQKKRQLIHKINPSG